MNIVAISQDPIYIGTGGFNIGRVDNTIVRDPISKIPKIPGTSLAGTWRYYMAITLHSYFKQEYKKDRTLRKKNDLVKKLFIEEAHRKTWIMNLEGNKYSAIKCAGQDENPRAVVEDVQKEDMGHCGCCIVCKTFGYSKKDRAERGMAYFSDLNVLFFPVYTRFGTRWITSKDVLCSAKILDEELSKNEENLLEDLEDKVIVYDKDIKTINIGWLNFEAISGPREMIDNIFSKIQKFKSQNVTSAFKNSISAKKIIIVSDSIISHIINSNLETRTSVSIDPITGAAKDGALFTSEAIPRGTVFYGNIRIEKRPLSEKPEKNHVRAALNESKRYFESLGIGGMTTRGFGRLKIFDKGCNENENA